MPSTSFRLENSNSIHFGRGERARVRRCHSTGRDIHLALQIATRSVDATAASMPMKDPVLLIMGLGAGLTIWNENFIAKLLLDGGFDSVIRFDNRDVGRSTHISVPDVDDDDDDGDDDESKRHPTSNSFNYSTRRDSLCAFPLMFGGHTSWGKPPYTLHDMMLDAVALLDHLQFPTAHWIGYSMGGAIAQLAAIHHPERVASLVCINSTSGNHSLPAPALLTIAAVCRVPFKVHRWNALMSQVPVVGGWFCDSPKTELEMRMATDWTIVYNEGPSKEWVSGKWEHELSHRPEGQTAKQRDAAFLRQFLAVRTAASRDSPLSETPTRGQTQPFPPTGVIFGTEDRILPPVHGYHLASILPGAKLLALPGMGHGLWPAYYDAMVAHIATVAAQAVS